MSQAAPACKQLYDACECQGLKKGGGGAGGVGAGGLYICMHDLWKVVAAAVHFEAQ